ncbi:MAG: putative PhzF superfamily epimerase YddE/YHI9 [Candidatus Midichloriaceae bacterium]|jgi:predicted PhzF superfamily epimerase YddE/YHI9
MFFYTVYAFSNNVNSGNPAAVSVVDSFPDNSVMQKYATKFNFSQTAFVKPIVNNKFHIRWFTPNSEAPLCIHATLAASHVIFSNKIIDKDSEIKFINQNNEFIVTCDGEWINLMFPSYETKKHKENGVISDILKGNKINFVGISENVLLAEFDDEDELNNFRPNLEMISSLPYRALLITSKSNKYDFVSRYFAPSVGINEDPVCGSAHCRLTPYWSKKLDKHSMVAYQASKRGGILKCKNLKNKVIISGQAVTVDQVKL